jgi:predicted RNA-binding protein with PIN domain
MSRHLYDLEKIMNTSFAQSALQNTDLYKTVINHRQKFNNIQIVDYQTHYPAFVQIVPPENLINSLKEDYESLKQSFIYEDPKKTFDEIIEQLQELTKRVRKIEIK